jgi:hypothetical protein
MESTPTSGPIACSRPQENSQVTRHHPFSLDFFLPAASLPGPALGSIKRAEHGFFSSQRWLSSAYEATCTQCESQTLCSRETSPNPCNPIAGEPRRVLFPAEHGYNTGAKRQTLPFCAPQLFFAFLAQKSHVKPRNQLTIAESVISAWRIYLVYSGRIKTEEKNQPRSKAWANYFRMRTLRGRPIRMKTLQSWSKAKSF